MRGEDTGQNGWSCGGDGEEKVECEWSARLKA